MFPELFQARTRSSGASLAYQISAMISGITPFVTTLLYLSLGWLCVLPTAQFTRAVGWRAMNWVWAGAGFYSLGAVCELAHWPVIVPGWVQWHEVLHFCDTAGSLCLFLFVVRHVIPYRPAVASVGCTRVAA